MRSVSTRRWTWKCLHSNRTHSRWRDTAVLRSKLALQSRVAFILSLARETGEHERSTPQFSGMHFCDAEERNAFISLIEKEDMWLEGWCTLLFLQVNRFIFTVITKCILCTHNIHIHMHRYGLWIECLGYSCLEC